MFKKKRSTQLTIVDHSTTMNGDLITDGDLMFEGNIKGDGSVKGRAMVATNAKWLGNIYAQVVEVHGHIQGDIFASGKIELHPTAHVVGDLLAPQISVLPGAKIIGSVQMGSIKTKPKKLTHDISAATSIDYSASSARQPAPV